MLDICDIPGYISLRSLINYFNGTFIILRRQKNTTA